MEVSFGECGTRGDLKVCEMLERKCSLTERSAAEGDEVETSKQPCVSYVPPQKPPLKTGTTHHQAFRVIPSIRLSP